MELVGTERRRLMVDGKNHHEAKKPWMAYCPGIIFKAHPAFVVDCARLALAVLDWWMMI